MPTYTTPYNLAKPLVNDATDQDIWGNELNANMDTINDTMKDNADAISSLSASVVSMPLGGGCDFFGTVAPDKFMFAYGQAISRTTYAALFAIIGTTFGSGDGSTTFNLPDKRGRVSAGKDNMGGTAAGRLTGLSGGVDGTILGATGGSQSHTLLITEIPSHTHTFGPYAALLASGGSGYSFGAGAGTLNTGSTGGGGSHNNVQPTIICNYIIRVE